MSIEGVSINYFAKILIFFLTPWFFSFILLSILVILQPNSVFFEMLRNLLQVIISPKAGWESIDDSSFSTQRVLFGMFFPLLACLAISSFIPMIYDKTITLSTSLMNAIVNFSKYMIAYYLSSYLLSGFYPQFNRSHVAQAKLNNYLIYNYAFLILLNIITNSLNSDFTPLYFLMLYSPVLAAKGAKFLYIDSGRTTKFVTIASLMILLLPIIFQWILNTLINR